MSFGYLTISLLCLVIKTTLLSLAHQSSPQPHLHMTAMVMAMLDCDWWGYAPIVLLFGQSLPAVIGSTSSSLV